MLKQNCMTWNPNKRPAEARAEDVAATPVRLMNHCFAEINGSPRSPTNVTPADCETIALRGGGSEIEAAGSHPDGRSLILLWGPICCKILRYHMRRCGWTALSLTVQTLVSQQRRSI